MKWLKRIVLLVLLVAFTFLVKYLWNSFPIITGYSAKMACSCMYLGDRELKSVQEQELGKFPLQLANITVNPDSTVSATIAGMAKQTAVFRQGLGCTLVNELSLDEIKSQAWQLAELPPIHPDTVDWPMGDRLSVDTGISLQYDTAFEQSIRTAIQFAFTDQKPEEPLRTRAVVVLHKGKLIAEQYAPGYDRQHRHLSWSMAKSITGTLIGMLVKEGKISVDQPAPVKEWLTAKDGREQITVQHLLQQTSGLGFEENYNKSSDATNMLFKKANMADYTAAHPLKDKPGTLFYYSSGNSNILSGIIRSSLGDSLYHRYPYEQLFYKLGMYSPVMEVDASGNFVGSSYVFANARDWARLGQLYLQKGNWMGEQLLPENWVQLATTPSSVAPMGEYGYQIWLNAGAPGNATNRKFPKLPADLYYFNGFEGQHVYIIPSKQLVIVRLGQTANSKWFDTQGFVNGILEAIN
jgi:hypothetical protein